MSIATSDQKIKTERAKADQARQDGLETLLGRHEEVEASEATALVPRQQTSPAPVTDDPLQDYLDTYSVDSIPGTKFRFNGKDAKYVLLDGTAMPLLPDDKFIFMSDQIYGEWIRFYRDGVTLPMRIGGLLSDGFRLPPRESLGELDESKWEIGLSGRPEDPFKHQLIPLFQKMANGELFAFLAPNPTSRGAVTDLLRHCQRRKRSGKDDYPIVQLDMSSFMRTEPPKVKVWKPHFTLKGHQPKDEALNLANASIAADLNDDLPDNLK
jgi:hypothetical protein